MIAVKGDGLPVFALKSKANAFAVGYKREAVQRRGKRVLEASRSTSQVRKAGGSNPE
jgi:hypothetical protein